MLCSMIVLFLLFSGQEEGGLPACIKSIICWTGYMYLITEITSVFRILNRLSLIVGWGFFSIILLIVYLRFGKKSAVVKDIKSKLQFSVGEMILGVIGAIAFLFAIITVPYNWDSMTYHLARLNYWRQNQSVAHYATNIIRQVTSPVLAEFVNLNVYVIMGGNDRFLQLLQYFSYIANAAVLYGISAKLGCRKKICFLAVLLFMTMPIAFGEALTTQVDHFAALWAFIFVYILLDYVNIDKKFDFNRKTVLDTIFMSASIAFAYLAKPSVMFAILFFAFWLLVVCIRRKEPIGTVMKLFICAACTLGVLLAPEVGRNLYTFHALSAPIAGARQLIGRKNPRYVFINFLKNFVWNFPNRYWTGGGSEWLTDFMYRLADLFKVEINDPGISEDGRTFAMGMAQDYGHDTAINPIIVITLIVSLILRLFNSKGKSDNRIARGYLKMVILSFLFFCAVLRWEPYVTRYMLSYLGLLCPAVAVMVQDLGNGSRYRKIYYAYIGIIIFSSLVEMAAMIGYHGKIACRGREDENRASGYFYWQPSDMYLSYLEMERVVKESGFKNIGLITSEVLYDYPVFKMLEPYVDKIEHVNVNNETGIYEDMQYHPECIIVLDKKDVEKIDCHGEEYDEIMKCDENVTIVK